MFSPYQERNSNQNVLCQKYFLRIWKGVATSEWKWLEFVTAGKCVELLKWKLPNCPNIKGKKLQTKWRKNQSCWVAEKTEKELEKLQVFWLEWNSKCFQSRSFTTGSNTRLNVLTNRRKWNWNESIKVLDVSFFISADAEPRKSSSKMRVHMAIAKTGWKSWRLQKPRRNSTWIALKAECARKLKARRAMKSKSTTKVRQSGVKPTPRKDPKIFH